MRTENENGWLIEYYDSLSEYAERATHCTGAYSARVDGIAYDVAEAARLAHMGWQDALPEVEQAAANLVDSVERESSLHTFETVYDVTGADVDVGRYLSGEPECMVQYPLIDTPRAGRVVTMCASVTYSGSATDAQIRARGLVMTAAAFALERLGLNTELWADRTIIRRMHDSVDVSQRILVKGANDALDPGRVLYAFAHKTMLHCLGFGTAEQSGNYSGNPQDPHHWLPEGAVYVPTFNSARDSADPTGENLRRLLTDIGVLAERTD